MMRSNTQRNRFGRAAPGFHGYAAGWQHIERQVLARKAGDDLRVVKAGTASPLRAGYRRSIGRPKGTLLHYRKALDDGRGLHVREYEDTYAVHWDRRDPSVDPIGHLVLDAPGFALAGLLALGIAYAATRRA